MFLVKGFEVDGEIGLVQLIDQATREIHRSFGPMPPGRLRGSQYRVLAMVPRHGSRRLTDLATMAGMTKQALGEFVGVLADGGYVSITPDLDDRRAKLVSLTRRGRAALDQAQGDLDRVDDIWAERLGRRDFEELKRLLARVAGIS